MKQILLAGALATLPALAAAQIALSPGIGADPMTCGQYGDLDVDGQVAALSALPTAGDDIGLGDQTGARQWAETVLAACAGHPDRPLSDVATEAFEGD